MHLNSNCEYLETAIVVVGHLAFMVGEKYINGFKMNIIPKVKYIKILNN